VPYRGHVTAQNVEVRRSARRRSTVTVFREGGKLVAVAPARLSRRTLDEIVPDLVEKFLVREKRRTVPAGTDELAIRARDLFARHVAPVVDDPLPAFSVRWATNQNRRWGSCTPADGTIRLSDRLRQMPSWVVDYVLLHEVLHLIEYGHTRRFRTLLNRYPLADRARGYLEGWSAVRLASPAPDTELLNQRASGAGH